jgi:hypothetical protein
VSEPLSFIATCDLVGLTRGRSIRASELEGRRATGVGWVPADLALTTFGDIADPNVFGSIGDIRLRPDVTELVLPNVSIDDYVFGVAAVSADGNESLVAVYVNQPRR